jgi:hypothetical protein
VFTWSVVVTTKRSQLNIDIELQRLQGCSEFIVTNAREYILTNSSNGFISTMAVDVGHAGCGSVMVVKKS